MLAQGRGSGLPDDQGADNWLERLTGAHSSKPSFYAAWRHTAVDLERSITALREISTALCTTTEGAYGLSRAVVLAATRHFDASCVAMIPREGQDDAPSFEALALVGGVEITNFANLPVLAITLGLEAVRYGSPVLMGKGSRQVQPFDDRANPLTIEGLAVPLLADDIGRGSLVVLSSRPALVDKTDISILQILAQETVVALRNAALYHESELLREEAIRGWEAASQKARELERQFEQLQSARLQLLQERQQRLIDAERSRIATELHDSVAQHLISIGMNLEWCRRSVAEDGPLNDRLASTHDLSRAALARVRTTIVELSCLTADGGGLLPALDDLSQVLRTQIQVKVRERGTLSYVSPSDEHAIFHFIQEAIFNAVRHGYAKRGWVTVATTAKAIQVSIADDSKTNPILLRDLLCSNDPTPNSPVLRGIGGMRHRANELSARLEVTPRRGGGVRLKLVAPIRNQLSLRENP